MAKKKKTFESLTYKQQRFVQEYLRHGNGTAAAVSAGYSARSARVLAQETLLNPAIQAIIEDEREAWRQASKATREDLLAELMTIALGDPGDVFDITKRGIRIKNSKQMGRSRRMIASVSETVSSGEKGDSVSRKVTFHDKRGAINDVWEKLGFATLDPARDRNAFTGAIRAAMGRVKTRK